jgi:hypothetical protein
MSPTKRAGSARATTIVQEFDRAPAAQAAVAVRRAGLRPALERTFHWGEDTHGLVVAQEPPAGSEVALDSTVLLFISAPGERRSEPDAGELVGDERQAEASSEGEPEPDPGAARRTRRRARARHGAPAPTLAPAEQLPGPPEPHSPPASEATEGWAPEPSLPAERSQDTERTGVGLSEELERLLSLAGAQLRSGTGARWRTRMPGDPELTAGARVALLAAAGVLVAVLLFLAGAETHALQAAGAFNGTPISGVQTFVDKLRGNLVWLGGTAMGLVIAVVGIMFMAGHSRAHDLAIRTIVGLAILASISGIVA